MSDEVLTFWDAEERLSELPVSQQFIVAVALARMAQDDSEARFGCVLDPRVVVVIKIGENLVEGVLPPSDGYLELMSKRFRKEAKAGRTIAAKAYPGAVDYAKTNILEVADSLAVTILAHGTAKLPDVAPQVLQDFMSYWDTGHGQFGDDESLKVVLDTIKKYKRAKVVAATQGLTTATSSLAG